MIIPDAKAHEMRCCGPQGCGRDDIQGNGTHERSCIGRRCMAWQPVSEATGCCGLAPTYAVDIEAACAAYHAYGQTGADPQAAWAMLADEDKPAIRARIRAVLEAGRGV